MFSIPTVSRSCRLLYDITFYIKQYSPDIIIGSIFSFRRMDIKFIMFNIVTRYVR